MAMMGTLDRDVLGGYVDNLNKPHAKWRREVLESVSATKAKNDPEELVGKLDTDVLEAMELAGLTVREYDALVYVLRMLGASQRGKLDHVLASDNGPDIKRVMSSDDAFPEEMRRRSKEADEAAAEAERNRKKEETADIAPLTTDLPADRQRLERGDLDAIARQAMHLLNAVSFSGDDATEVLKLFVPLYEKVQRPATGEKVEYPEIRAVTKLLDRAGLLDKLVDKVPEDARQGGDTGGAFLAVIRYRAPEHNVRLMEKLLSTGFLGLGGPNEREAQLAYLIIKEMPLRVQDNFRRRDDGELFFRMEKNFGKEFLDKGRYKGVEVSTEASGALRDVSQEYASGLAKSGLYDAVSVKLGEGFDRDKAEQVFNMLRRDGRDHALLTGVVRRLDAQGNVEKLLDKLGHAFLWDETNRPTTLLILGGRDPLRLVAQMKDLLSLGFFDWAVTSEEAFLAFNLLRALPERDRAVFLEANHGEWWKTIQKEMSAAERASIAATFYGGGEGGKDRQAIRVQLLDDKTWKPESDARLATLVNMALVAGDGEWVFRQSMEREAWKTHADAVRRFALYDPTASPPREKYQPEVLPGTDYSVEGPMYYASLIANGMRALFGTDHYELLGKSSSVKGLDLLRVQSAMAGDVAGARFKKRAPAPAKGQPSPDENVNKLDATIEWATGKLSVDAKRLEIASFNTFLGTSKLRIGGITIRDAHVSGHVPTNNNPDPLHLRLDVSGVDVMDLLLVTVDSMVGASHVGASAVGAELGRPGDLLDTPDGPTQKNATVLSTGIPIFSLMLDPLLKPIFEVLDTKKRLGSEVGNPHGVSLSIGSLTFDGIQTSGGAIGARQVVLGDVVLGGGQSKSAYYEALGKSLVARIARAKAAGDGDTQARLEAQQAKIVGALPALLAKEQKLYALQDRYRLHPEQWSKEDQRSLDAMQADPELKGGGLVVDIGELSLKGLEGKVTADDLTFKNVHGEREGAALGFQLVTKPQMIADFVARGPKRPPAMGEAVEGMREGASVSLELGTFDVTNLRVKGDREVPDLGALSAQIAWFEAEEREGVLDREESDELRRLRKMQPLAEKYWAMLPRLTLLSATDRAEWNRVASELEEQFRERNDIVAALVHLGHATLDVKLDAERGGEPRQASIALRADALEAKGLARGTMKVDRLAAAGFRLGGGVSGGLVDAVKAAREGKLTAFATLGADTLDIEGVHDALKGLDVGRVHAEGLDTELASQPGDLSAGVRAHKIVVSGLTLDGTAEMLSAELERLHAIPAADRTKPEQKRHDEIGKRLASWLKIEAAVDKASPELARAKTEKAKKVAQAKVDEAKSQLATWGQALTSLEVTDLDVALGGLASKGEKLTVEGRGGPRGDRIAGSAVIEGAPLPGGRGRRVALTDVTGGVSKDGDHYTLRRFGIGDVQMANIDWRGQGTRVAIERDAHLVDVSIDAEVELTSGAEKKQQGEKAKAIKSFVVHELHVGELTGHGLHAHTDAVPADPKKKEPGSESFDFDLPSGTIRNLVVTEFDLNAMTGTIAIGDRTKDVTDPAGRVLPGFDLSGLGLKIGSALSVQATLHGRGLSMELKGPDHEIIKLGRTQVERAAVAFDGNRSTVSAKDLELGLETTKDATILTDLAIGSLTVHDTLYKQGPDLSLAIPGDATFTKVGLKRLELRYAPPEASKDPKKKGKIERPIKKIVVRGIEVLKLQSSLVKSHGKFTNESTKVTRTADVDIGNAVFDDFHLASLERETGGDTVIEDLKLTKMDLSGIKAAIESNTGGAVSKVIIGPASDAKVTAEGIGASLTLTSGGKVVGEGDMGPLGLSVPMELHPAGGGMWKSKKLGGTVGSIDFKAEAGKDINVTLGQIDSEGTDFFHSDKPWGAKGGSTVDKSILIGKIRAIPGATVTFNDSFGLKSAHIPKLTIDPRNDDGLPLPGFRFHDFTSGGDLRADVSSALVEDVTIEFDTSGTPSLVKIKKGVVNEGQLHLPATLLSASGAKPAAPGGAAGKAMDFGFLSALNGHAHLQVTWEGLGLNHEDIDIPVADGKFELRGLVSQLKTLAKIGVDVDQLGQMIVMSVWNDPGLIPDGNQTIRGAAVLDTPAEATDFANHNGLMHLKYLIKIIQGLKAAATAQKVGKPAPKPDEEKESAEKLWALLWSINLDVMFKVNPAEVSGLREIVIPGVGTLRLGKPEGIASTNEVGVMGRPFTREGAKWWLQLDAANWKGAEMDLTTGTINLQRGKISVDPDFIVSGTGEMRVDLGSAQVFDIVVKLPATPPKK